MLWALLLPIAEKLPSAGQFSYCGDRCPPNALNVVDWPGPARVLGALVTAATAASRCSASSPSSSTAPGRPRPATAMRTPR